MSHPRVVNVRAKGARWDVYIGRGRCPATRRPGKWGNPFKVEEHGPDAMRLYVDWLAEGGREARGMLLARVREQLAGRVLGCFCAPRLCHGEVLARLADGEPLEAIRADVLAQVEELRARAPARRRVAAGPVAGVQDLRALAPRARPRERLQGEPRPSRSSGGLQRHQRMPKANRARVAQLRAATFGPCARLARFLPCCVPTCHATPPSDPCHVRSRGAGGKDRANVFPACRRHHREQHDHGVETFAARHSLVLEVVAARVAELVDAHDCLDWPERRPRADGLRCAVCHGDIDERELRT